MTFGPRQQPHKLIPYTIIELLRQRDPLLRSGNRVCDFVYVVDLVRGLLRACLEDDVLGQVVELGTGTGVRIADAAEAICEIVGGAGRPAYDGTPEDHVQPRQVARSDEQVRLPGWEPLWSLQDGLRETVTWYYDWMHQLREQSLT